MKHIILSLATMLVWCIPFLSFPDAGQTTVPVNRFPDTVLLELSDNHTTAAQIIRLYSPLKSERATPERPSCLEVTIRDTVQLVDIGHLRAIHFLPDRREIFVSDPSITRVKYIPSSTDTGEETAWQGLGYDDSQWHKAMPAHPNYWWFYIPGATWIWQRSHTHPTPPGTLLARHSFQLPRRYDIRSAMLYITVDETIHQVLMNGQSLPIQEQIIKRDYLALDVTYYLQEGKNLLALKASKSEERGHTFAGLAFRIDVDLVPEGIKEATLSPPPCEILLENDDLLRGELASLTHRWVGLLHNGKELRIDRDWVRRIRLNYDVPSRAEFQKRNIFQKILGLGKTAPLRQKHYPPYSTLVHPEDSEKRIGLLLKSGEFLKGRILTLEKRRIIIKPRYGPDFSIDVGEIQAIYPNAPGKKLYLKYPEKHMPWRCDLSLLDGSRMSGILMNITPRSLTITPPYSNPITWENTSLASCVFPYVQITKTREFIDSTAPPSVALIGENNPGGPPYELSTYYKVHCILAELGVLKQMLPPEQTINPDILSPSRFQLLLNLDEMETYYKTVQKPNDGYQALVQYVRSGGNLVHVGVGAPAFYGYEKQKSHWKRTTTPPYLNNALKMKILTPGEVAPNAQPFELPDNRPGRLYFELNTSSPYAEGLPEQVDFPFHYDTRFRPIVADRSTTATSFIPIYRLRRENGADYGPAMAVIEYNGMGFQPTRCFYVSHLLFNARYHRHSMLNHLIPKIVSLSARETIAGGGE